MKRFWLVIIGLLLMGGLWITPVRPAAAQEETAVEQAAEEENTNAGPGAFIVLVGLGAILFVGLTYMARQNNDATKTN